MREIPLTQGKVALVDDEDFEEVNQFKWYANKIGSIFYAARAIRIGGRLIHIRMHRYLLNALSGQETDHRNHNGLDNRRENIRTCSHAENSRNKQNCRGGSSKFKGVYWDKKNRKWKAQIMSDGRCLNLGRFVGEVDAAKIYDKAAMKFFGEFAFLNFGK